MPYVMAFNRPAIEDRMVRLAAWLGLAEHSYQAVLDWVLGLRAQLEIPHTLAGIGVDAGRAQEISEMAAADPTAPTNPIPLNPENLRRMFDSALEGKVA